MQISGVYELRNTINGKTYIGSSIDVPYRWSIHKVYKGNTYLAKAIRKYGWDSFDRTIVETVKTGGMNKTAIRKELLRREQSWIDSYRSEGKAQYNLCHTAGSPLGLPRSEETRVKLSKSLTGRKLSANAVASISQRQRGVPRTEATRRNISLALTGIKRTESQIQAMRGRIASEETRAKMRTAKLGRHLSDDAKRKVGDASRGRKHTEETRKKISERLRGLKRSPECVKKMKERTISPESRLRMRMAKLGKKRTGDK